MAAAVTLVDKDGMRTGLNITIILKILIQELLNFAKFKCGKVVKVMTNVSYFQILCQKHSHRCDYLFYKRKSKGFKLSNLWNTRTE